jgi:hypothetical protein
MPSSNLVNYLIPDHYIQRQYDSVGLILLRHGRRRLFDAALAPQHGHRGKVLMSSRIKWARMVAIEFGMWRSGRAGGASGSIIFG